MRAIKTTAILTEDGKLTVQLPPDIPAGEHQVVLVIDEKPVTKKDRPPLNFPVHNYGTLPADFSLRREDIYDDWGR